MRRGCLEEGRTLWSVCHKALIEKIQRRLVPRNQQMKRSKLILLIMIAVIVLSHRSDGQQPRSVSEQLRLAAVMPAGAMLYIQARDLSTLMKTWLASPVR